MKIASILTRRLRVALLTLLALTLTIGAAPAQAASTLPAPAPRYYSSGNHTRVEGLNVKGAVKYQVIRRVGTSTRVVGTWPTTRKPDFYGDIVVAVRAIDRYGKAGALSPYTSVGAGQSDVWMTTYRLDRGNNAAFLAATAKFMKDKGIGCAKDKAFNAAFNKVRDRAYASSNLYTVSAAALATYYKKLYDSAFTNNCGELTKVGLWAAELGAAATWAHLHKGKDVPSIWVYSQWVTQKAFPDWCQYRLGAANVPAGAPGITNRDIPKRISKSSCAATAERWVR